MKVTSRVSVTLREVKSPIHDEHRGMVLLASLPNQEGRTRTGLPCTSFKKPYLVHSTVFIDKKDTERFIQELKDRGFYQFDIEA